MNELTNKVEELLKLPTIELIQKYMQQEQEINKYKEIVNELEEWLEKNKEESKFYGNYEAANNLTLVYSKLQELKGD